MKIVLTGPQRLEIQEYDPPESLSDDEAELRVLYCAVCRTDAKMWSEGHRDLVLPRVPGHEIVAVDQSGARYVVWPGISCGVCPSCLAGQENRCRYLKILGFHKDGGFADQVVVPKTSRISVPDRLNPVVACFAEPAGCVFHALNNWQIEKNSRFLIYGGGTMGLLAALVLQAAGVRPVVIEKKEEKIKAAGPFLNIANIACVTETSHNGFDAVINACPDTGAFQDGLKKLKKGGTFAFFSGLTKNAAIATDILDLIHYHEITVSGSYGLTPADMKQAVIFLTDHQPVLKKLIQDIVAPERAPELMAKVLSGNRFKYILDFSS